MISTVRPAENDGWRPSTVSCKVAILWVVIALSRDFEDTDSILQIGHVLSRNGLGKHYSVTAPKCRSS